MSKLLNCPFCGGEAIIQKLSDSTLSFVVCVECRMRTPTLQDGETAMRVWNTRTPMDNIVEKLEEEYVDCQKNMNLVKDEDGNEAGHIYDEYLNKSIAYETAINIVEQEINNGLE